MKDTFFFVGNRFHVLEVMLESHLHVPYIYAVKGSYLESVLLEKGIQYQTISSKAELIQQIRACSFNYFISNGLPYILPESILQESQKLFINVHPSYLPDLKGADPVPGAILFSRDSGATVHFINHKIDEGNIISQVRLPFCENWDAVLLYQLSFLAEKEAFRIALNKNFKQLSVQQPHDSDIYYSFKSEDLIIHWSDTPEQTLQKIKAFNTPSKGARFYFDKEEFIVKEASIIPFSMQNEFKSGEIIFVIGNNFGIFIGDKLLFLRNVSGKISLLKPKMNLFDGI